MAVVVIVYVVVYISFRVGLLVISVDGWSDATRHYNAVFLSVLLW